MSLHEYKKNAVTALIWCDVMSTDDRTSVLSDLNGLLAQENREQQEQIIGDGFFGLCSRMAKPVEVDQGHWKLAFECVIYRDSVSWELVVPDVEAFTKAVEAFLS